MEHDDAELQLLLLWLFAYLRVFNGWPLHLLEEKADQADEMMRNPNLEPEARSVWSFSAYWLHT